MHWRPLSVRDDPERSAEYDALHDGVPEWLVGPISQWISDYFEGAGALPRPGSGDARHRADRADAANAATSFRHVSRVSADPGALKNQLRGRQALDLVDAVLCMTSVVRAPFGGGGDYPVRLEGFLASGGSAYKVTTDPNGRSALVRRVDGTVEAAAHSEVDRGGNAGRHLHEAWHSAFGRNPNPSHAYREAVRAVEAAAKPVISPSDRIATLGKMITALRDKPTKWTTAIGSVQGLADMMATLWTDQLDRHGTDDETVELHVSQAQAEAAIHIAVTLVAWLRSEAIRIA